MPEHTPGPWTYDAPDGETWFVQGADRFDVPRSEADARLIAAAPTLLAALERGTFSLSYDEAAHDYVLHYHASYDEAEAIRAAIAQAKGEE